MIEEIGAVMVPVANDNANGVVAVIQQFFGYKLMGKRFKTKVTYEKHINALVAWYRTKGHTLDLDIMGIEFLSTLYAQGLSCTTVNAY